jgi:hypothetical protein
MLNITHSAELRPSKITCYDVQLKWQDYYIQPESMTQHYKRIQSFVEHCVHEVL